jgi:hypothetical protein
LAVSPLQPFPHRLEQHCGNSRQREEGQYPGAARLIPELDRYGTVFLGYPIWAVDLPRLLVPFLLQQDFGGTTLARFCTSAMSGLAGTEQALPEVCPQALVLRGLSLPGGGRGHNTLVTSIGAEAKQVHRISLTVLA